MAKATLSPLVYRDCVIPRAYLLMDDDKVERLASHVDHGGAGAMRFPLPSSAEGRRRIARAFQKANKARLLAGLPLLLLLLPQDAFAQADGMVSASAIDGVQSATLLPDGTVELVLENGTTVIVPAESVQVLPGGEILVAPEIIASVGEIMVAGVEAGALAGVGPGVVAGAGGLLGLGALGAGGGAAAAVGAAATVGAAAVVNSGFVVDGYVAGATVFRDLNENGVLDTGEPSVLTDERGAFTGLEVDASNPDATILSTGGVDIATGQPFVGTMSAPADATVITPLTTLVQASLEADPTLDAAQAAGQLAQTLGLDPGTDLLNDDPVAQAEGGDSASLQAAVQVANVLNLAAAGSEEGSAEASDAAAAALAQAISNAGDDSPLIDPDALEDVVETAVGADRAADIAAAARNANEAIENLPEGDEGLKKIEQVLTVVQGDLVQAVEAGETVGETDVAAAAAAVVPLRPTMARGATELNAEDKAQGITFAGTGRPDTEVTVDFGGALKSVTVDGNGTWSVTYTAAEFPADPVDGIVTARATAKAAPDSPSSPAATRTIALDSTPPDAATGIVVAGDGTVNAVERADGFDVTGTAEAGATVTVTLAGAAQKTTTVGQDGTWTASYAGLEADDGAQTGTVAIVDPLGNAGPVAQFGFTLDTAATPDPVLDAIAGDGIINADEAGSGVTITGTAEAGTDVTVTLGNVARTVTADAADGRFSAEFTAADIPDDGTARVTATAVDAVGNASDSVGTLIEVNRAPPGAPQIDRVTDDNVLNATELSDAVTITGTVEAGSTVRVAVNGVTLDATVTGGTWAVTFDAADLGPDGPVTIQATATNALGNAAIASRTFTLDTGTDTPVIDPVSGGSVNAAEAAAGVQISGQAEAGAQVTVQLTGDAEKTVTANGSGAFTATFAASDLPDIDGEITVTATALDPAGNVSAAGTQSFTLDFAPPATPVIDPISDGLINRLEASAGVEITGTADTGSSVAVTFGSVTKTVLAESGTWSVRFTSAELPADGTDLTVTATATAPSGNVGDTGTATVTLDTGAPAKPTIGTVATDDIVAGAEKTDGIGVTGTAETDATVRVRIGQTTKEVTATGGTWEASFSAAELPADGARVATAQTVDAAGNVSIATNRTITFDTATPAPTIGPVADDDIVNIAEAASGVVVSGTAEPGATVTLSVQGDDEPGPSATADASGAWVITIPQDESDPGIEASFVLEAVATDTAGNTSETTAREVDIDTAAPDMPTIDPFDGDMGNTVNAMMASQGGEIGGTAAPGETVAVTIAYSDKATVDLGTALVDASGDWTVLITPEQIGSDGPFAITAIATDAAGNSSAPGTLEGLIDTTPPAAPVISVIAEDDVIGFAEASEFVLIPVTAPGAATVEVTIEGVDGTFEAVELDGVLAASIPPADLPEDGTGITVTAVAIDEYGNRSAPGTREIEVQTTLPGTPTIDPVATDDTINETEATAGVTITGTAEAESEVTVSFRRTDVRASATADDGGTWSVSFAGTALPDDATYTVQAVATDAVGNASPAGTRTVTLDTTAPSAPGIDPVGIEGDNVVNADAAANPEPLEGTGTPGDTITVVARFADGASVEKTATVDAGGVWSITITPADVGGDGDATLTATATDAAGNTSNETQLLFTVDTTPPAPPVFDPVERDDVVNATEEDDGILVSGTAPGAAEVRVVLDGAEQTVPVIDGTFSEVLDGPFTDGATTVTAVAIDANGNESDPAERSVEVSTGTVPMPTIAIVSDDDLLGITESGEALVLSGTKPAGTSVEIVFGNDPVLVEADALGTWEVSIPPGFFPAGPDEQVTVTAVAIDAAGNRSAEATRELTFDTVAPVLTLDPLDVGGEIDAAERAGGVEITGTTDRGQAVMVTMTIAGGGTVEKPTTADGNGDFSVTFTAADLPVSGDVSFTAHATDVAGNAATAPGVGPTTVLSPPPVDETPPAAPVVDPIGDLNAGTAPTPLSITGTGEIGATIQANITFASGPDAQATTTVDANGDWTVTIQPEAIGGDGGATLTVTATDAAGNVSNATDVVFDIDAVPDVPPDPDPEPVITLDNGDVEGDRVSLFAEQFALLATADAEVIAGTVTDVPTGTTITATFNPGPGSDATDPIVLTGTADASGAFSITVPDATFTELDGMVQPGTLVLAVDGFDANLTRELLVNSEVGAPSSTKLLLGSKVIDPVGDTLDDLPAGTAVSIDSFSLMSNGLYVFALDAAPPQSDGLDYKVVIAYDEADLLPVPAELIRLDGWGGALGQTPGAPGTDLSALTSILGVVDDTLYVSQANLTGDLPTGVQQDADALYTIHTIPAAAIADAIPGPEGGEPPATNIDFSAPGIVSRSVALEDVDSDWTPGDTLPTDIVYIGQDFSNSDGFFVGVVERQKLAANPAGDSATEQIFLVKIDLETGATESVELDLDALTVLSDADLPELDIDEINANVTFDPATFSYTALALPLAGGGTVGYDYAGGGFDVTGVPPSAFIRGVDDENDTLLAEGEDATIFGGVRWDGIENIHNSDVDDDVIALGSLGGNETPLNVTLQAPTDPETHERITVGVDTQALTTIFSSVSGPVPLFARITTAGDIDIVPDSLAANPAAISGVEVFEPGDALPDDGGPVAGVDLEVDDAILKTFVMVFTFDTDALPTSFEPDDVTEFVSFGVTAADGSLLNETSAPWAVGTNLDGESVPEFDTFQLVQNIDGTGQQIVVLTDSQGFSGLDTIIAFDPGEDVLAITPGSDHEGVPFYTYAGDGVQTLTDTDLEGTVTLDADTGFLVLDMIGASDLGEDSGVQSLFHANNIEIGEHRDLIVITGDDEGVYVWRVDQDGAEDPSDPVPHDEYQVDALASITGLTAADLDRFTEENLRLPDV